MKVTDPERNPDRARAEAAIVATDQADQSIRLVGAPQGTPTAPRRHTEGQKEVHQLPRSDHYREALQDVDLAATLFARSAQQDVARMERLYRRLAKTGHLVSLTAQATLLAFDPRREFDLDLPDAFVLASVSDDLVENAATSAFVTKNTKDFDDPEVRDYLNGRGCQLMAASARSSGLRSKRVDEATSAHSALGRGP